MDAPLALDGPRLAPAAGGPADALVVLLHGVGADGADLIGLAPLFARALPGAAFVAPDVPHPFDLAPFGRQWFGLADLAPAALLAGARAAAPHLEAFLEDELARARLGPDRLALVGFSQGAMMALHVGLRRARPVAAILAYSGALVGLVALAAEIRSRPPVMLVHGDADPVVPFAALAAARAGLEAVGVAVEAHARPGLGHGIDEAGVELGAGFLARHLGSESRATGGGSG